MSKEIKLFGDDPFFRQFFSDPFFRVPNFPSMDMEESKKKIPIEE